MALMPAMPVCPADQLHQPQLGLIRGKLWKTSTQLGAFFFFFCPILAQNLSGVTAALQMRFYKIHTNNICYVIQGRVFYTFLRVNKTVHPVSQQGINIVCFQMEKNPACEDSGPWIQ